MVSSEMQVIPNDLLAEKTKQGESPMKRQHFAALFLLIFGGLFAYIRFDDGDTEGAIRTGIIFALAGTTMFLLTRLQPRPRSLIVNVIALILLGLFAYEDYTAGDTAWAIIIGIALIIAVVLTLFQNAPFVKEKIRPWLKPVPYIGVAISGIALIVLLILLFLAR